MNVYDRVFKKVEKEGHNGCWIWTGTRNKMGYGRFRLDIGTWMYVHRWSYEYFKGDIPEGLVVRHKCDNPSCVNPDHLQVGTQWENTNDRRTQRGSWWPSYEGREKPKAVKLDEQKVKDIRARMHEANRVLAIEYGCTIELIRQVKNRKVWPHVE